MQSCTALPAADNLNAGIKILFSSYLVETGMLSEKAGRASDSPNSASLQKYRKILCMKFRLRCLGSFVDA